MKSSVVLAFVSAIFLALLAMPANAQATRTWVSGVGDDANPCSRTAPCKTFAGAISKTSGNPGAPGEINCLDPGGFGALTITKSINIVCGQSGIGGVLVSGTPGMTVNVGANDRVILDGLDFEGLGAGTNGVNMLGAGQLIIRNSSIRDFAGFGVNIAGTAATPVTRVIVQNSFITANAAGGINMQGSSGATNNAEVLNTFIDTNGPFGIQVSGTGTLVLSASTISGNNAGLIINSPATIVSYGNNVIRNGGTPTPASPSLQ
jgi:hypothetical protein